MGYEIEKHDGFFEIRLSGNVSKFDVLKAFADLVLRDPRKQHPDLWVVAPEVGIPYSDYSRIVNVISFALRKPPISAKSAIVAANTFQQAQIELYREESSRLPIDLRVFLSRDEAIAWLTAPQNPPP